jgi:hypothetical protein
MPRQSGPAVQRRVHRFDRFFPAHVYSKRALCAGVLHINLWAARPTSRIRHEGRLAQLWLERLPYKQEVAGSSPALPTILANQLVDTLCP